jgi:DNA-binding GntR family transcriptional regulator
MADWSGTPAYQQVAEALRGKIRRGEVELGSQLPSLTDLMHEFGVSITVIRMALSQLRAEGFVVTHQGKGTFVREQLPTTAEPKDPTAAGFEAVMEQLQAIQDDLRRVDDRLERLERQAGG